MEDKGEREEESEGACCEDFDSLIVLLMVTCLDIFVVLTKPYVVCCVVFHRNQLKL